MKKGLVSVIVPMYNSQKTIYGCIKSILSQTYTNIEIIIVDDGSEDKSYDIVNNLIKKESLQEKIVLIKQENNGPASARNNAIKISNGEFIAFLDSDDSWHPNKILEQIKLFNRKTNLGLVACTTNNYISKNKDENISISFDKLIFKNYFCTSSVMVKSEVLQDIGLFNINKKYSEDYELWLRICKKYDCELICLNMVNYGNGKSAFGQAGLSSRLWNMEKGELSNYKYMVQNKYISRYKYTLAISYSLLKFLRRILIIKFIKLK